MKRIYTKSEMLHISPHAVYCDSMFKNGDVVNDVTFYRTYSDVAYKFGKYCTGTLNTIAEKIGEDAYRLDILVFPDYCKGELYDPETLNALTIKCDPDLESISEAVKRSWKKFTAN
jgi:hypothetical protein